jgi:hypothetical protein
MLELGFIYASSMAGPQVACTLLKKINRKFEETGKCSICQWTLWRPKKCISAQYRHW